MTILFFKPTASKEKIAFLFLLKLLILGCLLKSIFFIYNYKISTGWDIQSSADVWGITKWSLLYDALCISVILLPLFAILFAGGKYLSHKLAEVVLGGLFTIALTVLIFLNIIDIFYYRFHLQRADADLLYVLRNPLFDASLGTVLVAIAALLFVLLTGTVVYNNIAGIIQSRTPANRFLLTITILALFLVSFFITGTKKILPTFPLTTISPVQLPLVQNSLHSFVYSLYRSKETMLPDRIYMSTAQQESLFSIHKKNDTVSPAKNIVLFIMESVALDFFDTNSPYKVTMPFIDSLVNKSTFYENAFSYSYSSNKGITAILAGLPTITDIPIYHSNYTSIPRVSIGTALKKRNYNSAFFIGDNYDDFGFAKCSRWLGIDQYYSMESIPGYRQMEKHSMGLHDEYVLDFMQQKLGRMQQPFFAIQYNVSTHYPNDIPSSFAKAHPGLKGTAQMKTMLYYDECIRQFFKAASVQPWYVNSVFIFCSDHWAQPHSNNIKIDEVESFRIPLFIYEPGNEIKSVITSPVSQFDIANTLLYYGGINEPVLSYGTNLKDTLLQPGRTIFTKSNSAIYQAINDEYVLGFNAIEGTAVYCYAYKKDPGKKINLLLKRPTPGITRTTLEMKAFLQTAVAHYKGQGPGGE